LVTDCLLDLFTRRLRDDRLRNVANDAVEAVERGQLLALLAQRLLLGIAVDRRREDVCDRLDEGDVLIGKLPTLGVVHAEDPPRLITAGDRNADPARETAVCQRCRVRLAVDIFHDNRVIGRQRRSDQSVTVYGRTDLVANGLSLRAGVTADRQLLSIGIVIQQLTVIGRE